MLGDDDDEVENVDIDDDNENDENGGEYSNEGEPPTPHWFLHISQALPPMVINPCGSKYSCLRNPCGVASNILASFIKPHFNS